MDPKTVGWSDVVEMLGNPERYHWGFDAAFAHDLRSDLLAIRSTTMILTNTGEDLYQSSRRAHDLRPDFDFTELVGGTHDIVDEQPKAQAQAVSHWLQSHCEQIA